MTEGEWLKATSPDPMLLHPVCADERKRRLFACACARRVLYLLDDARFAAALDECEGRPDVPRGGIRALHAQSAREAASSLTAPHEHHAAAAVYSACDHWPDDYIQAAEQSQLAAIAATSRASYLARLVEECCQAAMVRDIFGNPFRPLTFSPSWRTDNTVALTRAMYDANEFSGMPILADALQDAGCDSDDILNHCRNLNQLHVRGCWVTDLVLGKG